MQQSTFVLLRDHKRLLATGFFLCFFSGFGQTIFIGAHIPFIREDFGLSHSQLSLIYAAATLCSAFTINFTGKLLDSMRLDRFVPLVLLGLMAGALIMGLTPYAALLFPGFFLLRQCGQGLMTMTMNVSMNRYLERFRGRAVSLSLLGEPAHIILFPLAGAFLCQAIGWQQAWQLYAVVIALIVLPLFLWLLKTHENTTHKAWKSGMDASEKAENLALQPLRRQWTRRETLRDWRLYALLSVMVISPCFTTAVFYYQGEIARANDISQLQMTGAFGLYTVLNVMLALGAGYALDRWGESVVLMAYPALYGIGLLLLGILSGIAETYIAFAFLASGGMVGVLGGPILARMYGTKHLGAIKSTMVSVAIVSTGVSPPLIGLLIDHGVSINHIWLGFAGYAFLSLAGLCVFLRPALRRLERESV